MTTITNNHLDTNHPTKAHRQVALSMMALVGLAAAASAQGRRTVPGLTAEARPESQESQGAETVLRRLESVTWNPESDELAWVVSAGTNVTGHYVPAATETYAIHLESATMRFKGEVRRFDDLEAQNVHKLMDIIVRYAVESTIWWDAGKGEKLDSNGNPIPGQKEEDKKKPYPSVRISDVAITRALRSSIRVDKAPGAKNVHPVRPVLYRLASSARGLSVRLESTR
jgi:hypothetical protein